MKTIKKRPKQVDLTVILASIKWCWLKEKE